MPTHRGAFVALPAGPSGWFGGAGIVASDPLEVVSGCRLAEAATELETVFAARRFRLAVALLPYDGPATVHVYAGAYVRENGAWHPRGDEPIIDGRPVCLEIRYMPKEIGEKVTGEMLATRAVHAFVGEIIGEAIPAISVSLTAEIATPRVARLLELPENSALLVRNNTHHASDGRIVVCGRSLFAGDVSTDYVLGQLPKTKISEGG